MMNAHPVLLLAFAFAVMADPVSSVAYAIEAALRALDGDLSLLPLTMAIVVGIMVLIVVNYHQLVARFPEGGGAAAAAGSAFGERWAFLPIASLIVDFVLTISISVSAAASAFIAYFPDLVPYRSALAVGLVLIVAGITWFGTLGRALFALLTMSFVTLAVVVLITAISADPVHASAPTPHTTHPVFAVALAFPVAMALATGIEAPASAIAQLGQLDDAGRRRFARITLWLMIGIVGTLTLGFAAAAVHLNVGVPGEDSTQIADLARAASPDAVFTAFQAATSVLLLAAASSSFQAGPGLLKALARRTENGHAVGMLHPAFDLVNKRQTPYVGVGLFAAISAVVTASAGGEDQRLVLFYAVAVFVSFLIGLLAMARFSHRDGARGLLVVNLVAALAVAFTLLVDVMRVDALISLAVTAAIAGSMYVGWARSGRPHGVSRAVAEAERD
jgi:amino acid transporter